MSADLINKTIEDDKNFERITWGEVVVTRSIEDVDTVLMSCPVDQISYIPRDGETQNLLAVATLFQRLLGEDVDLSQLINLKTFRAHLVIEIPVKAFTERVQNAIKDGKENNHHEIKYRFRT